MGTKRSEKKRREPAGKTTTGTLKTYTASVIGCGRIGSLLAKDRLRGQPCTHAGIYHAHDRVNLVAGCEIRAERRARFSSDWGIPASRIYEDYHDLFSECPTEIVSIATYTDTHAPITIAAARAGARIILCEKPMARNLEEARRMIEVCRSEGALLAIHHERRWQPDYRLYKEMIRRGDLGEIRTIIGNVLTHEPDPDWHSSARISGGGPTLHDGTHIFDIIRYLCGEIIEIHGEVEKRREIGVEHTGRAMLRLESGATAYVECGGRRRYFNFELDIQGTEGRLRIGNAVKQYYGLAPSSLYENFVEFAERPFPPFEDQRPYGRFIVDELIDAFETGRPSVSSGEDGLSALETVLAIYEENRIGTIPYRGGPESKSSGIPI